MDIDAVPNALASRLGPDATAGLLDVLGLAHREWSDDVMGMAADRFERRLAEEGASLRVQMARTEGALRTEIAQAEGRLRGEIGQIEGRLRNEIGQSEGRVRKELGEVHSSVRQELSGMEVRVLREIGNTRVELLKWSFLFWIGQVVTMSVIVATMLRIVRG